MWIGPDEHKIVGECLAAARRQAGITQAELAKMLNKPQSFVSAYEAGQRRVDILEFLAIAKALRADPIRLFAEICARRREGP